MTSALFQMLDASRSASDAVALIEAQRGAQKAPKRKDMPKTDSTQATVEFRRVRGGIRGIIKWPVNNLPVRKGRVERIHFTIIGTMEQAGRWVRDELRDYEKGGELA
jgi:hypothetical protein